MTEGSNSDASMASEKRYQNKKKNKKVNKRKKLHSDESDGNIENKKLMQIVEDQKKIIEDLTNEVSNLTNIIRELDNEEIEEDENIAINDNADFPALPKKYNNETVTQKTLPATTKQNAKDVTSTAIKRKPPPITVYNLEAKELINKIRVIIQSNNFNINIVNKNMLKVHTQKLNDYDSILKMLKTENTKFYTYTPKEKKPLTFIVKKLPLTFEVEDLSEAILNLKIQVKIIKVIKTKYNWLLQVTNDSSIIELKSIKYLLHCKVHIDTLRKTRILQCKNCQRFNHSALNCNMPYRCVKCGGSHEPGKCLIPPKEQNNEIVTVIDELTGAIANRVGIPVKCVNCGLEGHTANAKVCQVKINLLNKKNKNNKINKESTSGDKFLKRSNDIPYASLFKNVGSTNPGKQNQEPNPFDTINKDCCELFGKDLLTCFARVGEFNKSYSMLKTKEDKTKAIFSLLLSIKLND